MKKAPHPYDEGLKFVVTGNQYRSMRGSYKGLCILCGESRDQCEPDAQDYPCEGCGRNKVYGVEELLIMDRLVITP